MPTPTLEGDVASATNTDPCEPPPPPDPANDPNLAQIPHHITEVSSPQLAAQYEDVAKVPPLVALKLLAAGLETLVRVTGDIPPTPPPTSPTLPNMRGMQAEKENIVRSHSEKNLARLREQAMSGSPKPAVSSPLAGGVFFPNSSASRPATVPPAEPHARAQQQQIDGVHLRRTPYPTPASSTAPPSSPEPYIVIGANSQPLNTQHSAITRKFYSKAPPPISITDYLLRMHRFCPMSTAVYLATSLYIHRLAVSERAIAVTRRNAHRLLLAGLRVAMKALEDLSYPHAKIAKVGGVSEAELARLEISFCFLAGFELVVNAEALRAQWEMLRLGRAGAILDAPEGGVGALTLGRPPRGGG